MSVKNINFALLILLHFLFLGYGCKPKTADQHDAITNQSAKSTVQAVNVTQSGFIYEDAPFPECHASSIVDLGDGKLMCTWFGGTEEKNPDVTIWTSTYENGKWGAIIEVADGIQNEDLRYPCWNPVLFNHSNGMLYLFFKVGPTPRDWWGEMISSTDNGKTWSTPSKLPKDIMGPIRAKPIELTNGDLLCPSSWEYDRDNWKAHMELYSIATDSWTKIPVDHESDLDVIQPTILRHSDKQLQILCRSMQNRIVESWSEDNGKTWGPLGKTNVPNPSAGIDGVTLPNGKHLLVYNPTEDSKNDRAKLSLAISDDGKNWTEIYKLEDHPTGEFSYPAMIQSSNDKIQISYTWNREKIKYVELELL